MQENFEYNALRFGIAYLFCNHMNLTTTHVAACVSFFHVGALVGCVFFGCVCAKATRKISIIMSLIFSAVMYIVLSVIMGGFLSKRMSMHERDFLGDGNSGGRKIRPFIDPNLAKGLTNELGFEGAFSTAFNHMVLLVIILGFTMGTDGVSHTWILDVFCHESECRSACVLASCMKWWLGNLCGSLFGALWYINTDCDGLMICIALNKIWVLLLVAMNPETKGWERKVAVQDTPCYLKGLYYACFLWPQGTGEVANLQTFYIYDMQHLRASTAGHLGCWRWNQGRVTGSGVFSLAIQRLYIPTIGGMFLAATAVPNPLNISLFCEWFNRFRTMEGLDWTFMWIGIYPAFVGQYMAIESCGFFLGACAGLRQLAHFLAIGRWPTQLLCGDPMACWRGQYLFSHAIFYNCGGDHGNINYVNWYCGMKSQKRQCCCPYRKLKADAPDKCCPPCCLGPFVEETGGCPCPCCCASCSA